MKKCTCRQPDLKGQKVEFNNVTTGKLAYTGYKVVCNACELLRGWYNKKDFKLLGIEETQ